MIGPGVTGSHPIGIGQWSTDGDRQIVSKFPVERNKYLMSLVKFSQRHPYHPADSNSQETTRKMPSSEEIKAGIDAFVDKSTKSLGEVNRKVNISLNNTNESQS